MDDEEVKALFPIFYLQKLWLSCEEKWIRRAKSGWTVLNSFFLFFGEWNRRHRRMEINIGFIIFHILLMALSLDFFLLRFFACLSHNSLNVIFSAFILDKTWMNGRLKLHERLMGEHCSHEHHRFIESHPVQFISRTFNPRLALLSYFKASSIIYDEILSIKYL